MLSLIVTLTALIRSLTTIAEIPPFDSWPSRRIKLPEVFIHLKHHGSGPPLVLLHGQPQHSLTWHNCPSPSTQLHGDSPRWAWCRRFLDSLSREVHSRSTSKRCRRDPKGPRHHGESIHRRSRPRGEGRHSILPPAPGESRSISSVRISHFPASDSRDSWSRMAR